MGRPKPRELEAAMIRPAERFAVALTARPAAARPQAARDDALARGLRVLSVALCGFLAGLLGAAWLGI
jgi:hypothetical protein